MQLVGRSTLADVHILSVAIEITPKLSNKRQPALSTTSATLRATSTLGEAVHATNSQFHCQIPGVWYKRKQGA